MNARPGMTSTGGAITAVVSVLLLTLTVGACVPAAGGSEGPAPDTLEGLVVVTGGAPEPLTTLVTKDRSVVLKGDLVPELRRLDGAAVRAAGRFEGEGPGDALCVLDYEILEIDGQQPRVGVLIMPEQGLALETDTGEPLPVVGAPAALRDRIGARVWIVGTMREGSLLLQSYGILRPPDS